MPDLSRYSDADLMKAAGLKSAPDLSQFSDADLIKAAGLGNQAAPKMPDGSLDARFPSSNYSPAHYAGVTGRAVLEGLSSPAALPGNLGVMAYNKITGSNVPTPSQGFSQFLTNMGLPEGKTQGQRLSSDVISAVSNPMNIAFGPIGIASGVMGAGAGGIARENGVGPVGQAVASLAGGLTPAAVTSGIPGATRMLMRGGQQGADTMQRNIDTFANVGTTPTIGQASQSPFPQWMESTLSKTPGGGPILNKAANQADEIGQGIENMASNLSPKSSGEQAGRAIYKGVKNVFIPNARKVQNQLYGELDKYIPQDSLVDASNFSATANNISAPINGASNLSNTKLLSNSGVNELKDAAMADMAGTGKLPYQAIKEIRTKIGEKLNQLDLAPDVSKAELKQLYGALTQDMQQAAKAAGPQAEAAFNRANQYTKALHDRIDVLQNVIDKNGGPEKIFQAATSGTAEGATTFRAVMKSIPYDGKKMVAATILRRLGKATAGNQNDVGDVFSANSFLTNWNKLSPEAKSTMTGPFGQQFSKDMDNIAKVADNLKRGSKVYANPSGTAQAVASISGLTSFVLSLASGHVLGAAGVAGGVGTANLAARAFTSPTVVKWLAQNSRKPVTALPAALNALNQAAKKDNDQDAADFADQIQQSYKNQGQAQ